MGTVMASLLSPRRDRGDIDLAATEPTLVVGAAASDELPTVAWLALEAPLYITGSAIVIDGGLRA